MSIYYSDDRMQLLLGDCVEVMAGMEPDSVDAIVTDPPYDLLQASRNGSRRTNVGEPGNPYAGGGARAGGFMGKAWDATGVAFDPATWREAFRVAKPGAHLLAFGGTRTYHRLASAIEDAGWEIRDCLVWAYASGFPKSLDVSKAIDKAAGAEREVTGTRHRNVKPYDDGEAGWNPNNTTGDHSYTAPATATARQWDGWGTALKPAWEPIVMARKPLRGTVAANVQEYGTGALNIGATRIGTEKDVPASPRKAQDRIYGRYEAQDGTEGGHNPNLGRWPANLILTDPIFDGDYPEEVVGGGSSTSGNSDGFVGPYTAAVYGKYAQNQIDPAVIYADTGGKSRFFLISKAARSERESGLQGREAGNVGGRSRADGRQWDIPGSYTDNGKKQRVNTHPTVKSLDLMRHLVRLITPPDGLILDPFIGSGTTAIAASADGFRCIGIEQEAAYLDIAVGRLLAAPIGMGL